MSTQETRALVMREQDPQVLRAALLDVLDRVDLAAEFAAERTWLARLLGPTVREVGDGVRMAIVQALLSGVTGGERS